MALSYCDLILGSTGGPAGPVMSGSMNLGGGGGIGTGNMGGQSGPGGPGSMGGGQMPVCSRNSFCLLGWTL